MRTLSVIVRSCNDIAWIRTTLERLKTQHLPDGWRLELVTIDNASDDGTAQVLEEMNADGIRLHWPRGKYVPGKVLNAAIAHCSGEIVIFNNADSVPMTQDYLEKLAGPLARDEAEAVFARQEPRKDARPLIRKDYERAFGDGKIAAGWKHFFSLAAAGTRREVLVQEAFREDLQYSEDIEWSYRLRRHGGRIVYVAEAMVEHSHNYTLKQTAKRFYQEGVADGRIFGGECSLLRTFLLPYGRETLRDAAYLAKNGKWCQMPYESCFRLVQRWNFWRGRKAGLRGEICR